MITEQITIVITSPDWAKVDREQALSGTLEYIQTVFKTERARYSVTRTGPLGELLEIPND